MVQEDEFQQMWDRFLSTCTVTTNRIDEKTQKQVTEILVTDELAYDGIAFIMRALSPEARLGYINPAQSMHVTTELLESWFILVYVDHYEIGKAAIEKDAFHSSGRALIMFLMSRVEAGRDRGLVIERIKAQNPATNMIMPNR